MSKNFDYNRDKNEFTQEMLRDTIKYQQQYGFKIGQNNVAWNNEADAFRHAYMQSLLNQKYGSLKTKLGSTAHEWKGRITGQDPREYNMDMWNNQQGQQIYNEIRREYPNFNKLSEPQQKDIIAGKVVQKMKEGKLITDIDDKRKFEQQKTKLPFIPTRGVGGVQNNGKPLGFATTINASFVEQILQDLPQNKDPKNSVFPSKQEIKKFVNPVTGDSKIFTREKLEKMNSEVFSKNEDAIFAQLNTIGIPSQSEVNRAVYNSSSQNADGKWVTIKGHHVLIND